MENTKVNTTNKTTDDKNTDKTKVSCNEIFKTPTTSKHINRMPALEAEFKKVFGYDFSPSALSDIIVECDKEEVPKLFKDIKTCYPNDGFLNKVLENTTARANIVSKSTRLPISDWEFIDSVMTDTEDDKTVLRGKSKFIFFLAFLIYCERENISITKPYMKDFSNPIFNVMGNKKWFRDTFYSISKQLFAEKDIETTLDLFGGSGVLTGYVQDYCYKNNLNVESRYNDLDENKINFFKQLTTSPPKKLESKCRKLLKAYDDYKENGDTESILKLKKNAETLMKKKGLNGAAAFWYVNTTNENSDVNMQKRESLKEFAYASELYKNVIFERSDALYCLKKWYDNEKAFIIVDPPYHDTKGYTKKLANDEFDRASQQKLCNKLLNAKATWIYFGRTKASRSYINNQDKKKLAFNDAQHLTFFDDNFQNKGLFYLDVPHRDTVERIVSNYPFEGFKLYVEETASASKEFEVPEVIVSAPVEVKETEVIASAPVEAKETEVITSAPVEVKETEVIISTPKEFKVPEVIAPSPVQIEETETVENTVHTESSSAEEVKTDNHEPVIKEKTTKKRKECIVKKFFRKLLHCKE